MSRKRRTRYHHLQPFPRACYCTSKWWVICNIGWTFCEHFLFQLVNEAICNWFCCEADASSLWVELEQAAHYWFHSLSQYHTCHHLQQQGLSLCMMKMCEVWGTGSVVKHAPDLVATQLASKISFFLIHWYSSSTTPLWSTFSFLRLTLFPGLSHFTLRFAFTLHGIGMAAK